MGQQEGLLPSKSLSEYELESEEDTAFSLQTLARVCSSLPHTVCPPLHPVSVRLACHECCLSLCPETRAGLKELWPVLSRLFIL